MDIILKLLNLLLYNISGDLIILYSSSDNNLENTIGDRFFLPLSLPEETVHLDAEDLVGKGLEVGILTPWLDFPDDERFGNGGRLLTLLGCSSLCLNSFSGGGIGFSVFCKWIEIILFRGSRLGSLLLRRGTFAFALFLVALVSTLGGLALGSTSSSLL